MIFRFSVSAVFVMLAVTFAPHLFNAKSGLLNAIGAFIVVVAFLLLATVGFEWFRQWFFKKDDKEKKS